MCSSTQTHICEHTYVLDDRGQPDWVGCRWTDGEDELRKLLKGGAADAGYHSCEVMSAVVPSNMLLPTLTINQN